MPQRKYKARRQVRYSRSKKMVTGHGPTLLEKIASGAGSVAKLATAVAPVIAAINTESKYFDQTASVTSNSPGTGDQLINLTGGIVAGLTDRDRIGNSILAQDLQLRLAHTFNSTLGAPNVLGSFCRMMLICWKENATQNVPSIAKIFEVPTNIYSPVNKDNSDQFVVLKDKFFTMNNSSGQAGPVSFVQHKIFKKLNWHMRWGATDAASASQNHIYLILRSSAGSTNNLQTTYYSRLNYTDN